MGLQCSLFTSLPPWATSAPISYILTGFAFFLTIAYHDKAAISRPKCFLNHRADQATLFHMIFKQQASLSTNTVKKIWQWRIATLLIYIPQSIISALIIRQTLIWVVQSLRSLLVAEGFSIITCQVVIYAFVLFVVLFAFQAVGAFLVQLIWNTIYIFTSQSGPELPTYGTLTPELMARIDILAAKSKRVFTAVQSHPRLYHHPLSLEFANLWQELIDIKEEIGLKRRILAPKDRLSLQGKISAPPGRPQPIPFGIPATNNELSLSEHSDDVDADCEADCPSSADTEPWEAANEARSSPNPPRGRVKADWRYAEVQE